MALSVQAQAAQRGYTIPVFVSGSMADLSGFVRPDTDYDGRFVMVCAETGDTLGVCGWLVEDVQEREDA